MVCTVKKKRMFTADGNMNMLDKVESFFLDSLICQT